MKDIPDQIIMQLFALQKNEITEHHIYKRLAASIKNKKNSEVLEKIASEEMAHYNLWKKFTAKDIKPSGIKIFFYYWISKLFGLTFGLKLMERGEESAQINYLTISEYIKDAKKFAKDEDAHEQMLIGLIEEEILDYVGSIVLGLNDALVEFTGVLAGLTFALQNTRLIALAGLITGIAASFSMSASEYLSQRSEGASEKALRASIYTGIAYIITVFLLILPYLLLENLILCLVIMLVAALFIIFFFNFYISVAKDLDFKARFFEMTFISLGVSAITFLIGILIRQFLGIQV